MKDNDRGFSTPLAMTIIFSLSILIMGMTLYFSSSGKKLESYEKDIKKRKEIDTILFEVENDFQSLKELSIDSINNVYRLLNSKTLGNYNFVIHDVSSGIHRKFMNKLLSEKKQIQEYFAINTDEAFVNYGWLNPRFADEKTIKDIKTEIKNKNLFPLINAYSPLNIRFVNQDLLKTILLAYDIHEVDEKISKLINTLDEDMNTTKICEILKISETHPIFYLIGTKTLFWEVQFKIDGYKVCAIYAAIPEMEKKNQIKKYVLFDRDISRLADTL